MFTSGPFTFISLSHFPPSHYLQNTITTISLRPPPPQPSRRNNLSSPTGHTGGGDQLLLPPPLQPPLGV
ncbi:hypothetical protein LOK49_Contig32G00011 [Camellia lanceoleosa]|nr:hypothetical protein LOK49_Contig32G00011 [Camellia lanceoleosa]